MSGTLFSNAVIYTLDDDGSIFDSMFVSDGRIIELGDYKTLKEKYKGEVVDLGGKFVLPGFTESHIHVIEAARSIVDINLKNANSFQEFKRLLMDYHEKSKNEWIIGSGWSETVFGGRMPHRKDLDEIIKDKPVCLVRQDGHSVILNTKALDFLGLNNNLDAIKSQNAIKDKDGLTGLFYEAWVFDILGILMDKMPDDYFEIALFVLNKELLKNGVTMVNDIMTQYPRYYNIYKRLQDDGKINFRISAGSLGKSKDYQDFLKLTETEKLRKGPVKYFLDGSFGSKTALLLEGYEDEPQNKGVQTLSEEELYKIFENSLKNNIQIAMHAIGDLAVKKLLDIYEKVFKVYPNKNVRNRVEHIQIIRDEDIERFKRLNLTASFQPIFNLEGDLTISRVGLRRIKDTYRFRTFIEKEINVIFNSDTPFGSGVMQRKDGTYFVGFEPLLGIYCAVNDLNLNKKEIVTVEQAVKCYTKNAAYANHMEKIYGTLEEGKYADFVVLEEDIFKIDTEKIKDVEVLMTVVDGEIVYTKNI